MSFSPGDPLFLLAVLVAIVFGCWALLVTSIDLKQAILSKHWSPTQAILTELRFDRRSLDEDGEEFRPIIRYSYEVDARSYSSDKVTYQDPWSSDYKATAEPFSGLVVGSTLRIYVNPERPEQAVVMPGAGYACYVQLLFAFVFLGFAIRGLVLHLSL